MALVGLNLALATLYFSFKNKKIIFLTDGMIGWGDILFFVAITPLVPFAEFGVFFPVSLIFSLFCWLVVSLFKPGQLNKIPLAGLQAVFFAGYLVWEWVKIRN